MSQTNTAKKERDANRSNREAAVPEVETAEQHQQRCSDAVIVTASAVLATEPPSVVIATAAGPVIITTAVVADRSGCKKA